MDQQGVIRYTHFGEGQYDETEKAIQTLLSQDMPISNPVSPNLSQTPELYVGSDRFQTGFMDFSGD